MSAPLNHLCVYSLTPAPSPRAFVEFWADRYDYGGEGQYVENLCPPLSAERLHALFRWKVGRFYPRWRRLLEELFVSRRDEAERLMAELHGLDPVETARAFLGRFGAGGRPIWRVFWLHCWDQRFPIYDQHVHRAMSYIQTGQAAELPKDAEGAIRLYLGRYIPFFNGFAEAAGGMASRKLDQALWRFGLSLRDETLPAPSQVREKRRKGRVAKDR